MTAFLRERWEKNAPALRCALGGGFQRFVWPRHPAPLGDAVPVFCYHVVDADAFERDLQFLRDNGYRTIVADDLLDHLIGRRPAPRRSVVVTIDDGSANLYHVAYPLLCRLGMQAVAFICPGLHAEAPAANVPCGPAENWATDLCTWDQLAAMHRSGHVDVQSHTFEHRHLRRWPGVVPLTGCAQAVQSARLRETPLALEHDLLTARTLIEARLNKRVQHLAYPRMLGTRAARQCGLAAGYRAFWGAVTFNRAQNAPGDSPLHIVRLNHDVLYRLPGRGRKKLRELAARRLHGLSRPLPPARAMSGREGSGRGEDICCASK